MPIYEGSQMTGLIPLVTTTINCIIVTLDGKTLDGNKFSCLLSGSEGSSDISREVPVMVQAGAQVRDRGAASLPSSSWPLVAWSPPLQCYMPSIVHSSMFRK